MNASTPSPFLVANRVRTGAETWTARYPIGVQQLAPVLLVPDAVKRIPDSTASSQSPQGEPRRIPVWKRVLDVSCILFAAPSLAPVMLLMALLIKCVSRGPVLFKQERVGYRGTRFQCFKFRTMMVTNDQTTHHQHVEELMATNVPMTKMDAKGDPRIIPLGRLFRATGLDELPQLINVLRGEMSLVGPRPCLPFEYARYQAWQKARFNSLPGLTGLWQVSGKNRTTFVEMVQLDIQYARELTLWKDLQILLKTLPAVIVQTQELVEAPQTHRPSSWPGRPAAESGSVMYRQGRVASAALPESNTQIGMSEGL
jgi:exopolysaccharide production protein ExoY